jgi:hypothetical protein
MMIRCCSIAGGMAGLRGRRLLAGAFAALLAACSQAPKVVPIDQIAFPVVLITGQDPTNAAPHRADVEINVRNLSLMRVERYSTLAAPPIVIDSNARIFDMTEIKGAHGSMWMMINPTGLMPLTFKLAQRKQQGLAEATALITACDFLGRDLDSDRRAERVALLAGAQTMAEVIAIVDEMPGKE